ncbi:ANTAR domain-containing protein [Antrihabitans sp. YC2-6]|uniref:ANTAR domain-containing protein n=1 Tax=Antrihabitans sp. YC2-6 TaxID=2799498 RepID=UPI001F2647FC|nr:ANTAR domain-containing protein [Antrihabitans sp. YC2-6]
MSSRTVADAAVFADLITLALLQQADRADLTGAEWIRPEGSYQDVNVATGMLAARLRITLDDAFVRLRAHAFSQNRPLLDVARDVLEHRIQMDELRD